MSLTRPDTPTGLSVSAGKCPSCLHEVDGNYCQHCGEKLLLQNNDLSIRHFAKDAYHDVFDFDSKFLTTLKHLVFHPGFLTLEWLAGRRRAYMKPFRLYITIVVMHFLIFNMIPSGDMYDIDKFPAIKFSPVLSNAILTAEQEQTTHSPDDFKAAVNARVKDNLTILLYGIVFVLAGAINILYWKSKKFYVEHLTFTFHVFAFAFARNLLIIPLIMMNWMIPAIAFALGTQIIYIVVALKVVYGESLPLTVIKTLAVLLSVAAVFFLGVHAAIFGALAMV